MILVINIKLLIFLNLTMIPAESTELFRQEPDVINIPKNVIKVEVPILMNRAQSL